MRDDAGRVGEWRRSNEAPAEPAAAACAGSDYPMPAAYYCIPLESVDFTWRPLPLRTCVAEPGSGQV